MSSGSADGFLTRWARRKAEAQRVEEAPAQVAAQSPLPAQETPASESEEPFDLSTLPSIESLTADSDLSAFMRKGVPAELRDAAISRMWVAHPAIRDYVGPYDMMWDFNTGEAFHGYGALAPETDIARMVADIVSPRVPQPAEELPPAEVAAVESAPEDAAVPADAQGADSDETPGPSPDPSQTPVLAPRRRHGGATPV